MRQPLNPVQPPKTYVAINPTVNQGKSLFGDPYPKLFGSWQPRYVTTSPGQLL